MLRVKTRNCTTPFTVQSEIVKKYLRTHFEKSKPNYIDTLFSLESNFEKRRIVRLSLPQEYDKSPIVHLLPFVLAVDRIIVLTSSSRISREMQRAFSGTGDDVCNFLMKSGMIGRTSTDIQSFITPSCLLTQKNVGSNVNCPISFANIDAKGRKRVNCIPIDTLLPNNVELVIVSDVLEKSVLQKISKHFNRPETKILMISKNDCERNESLNDDDNDDGSRPFKKKENSYRHVTLNSLTPK